MSDFHFKPASLTDPLGEVLHMLRLTGTLYCRAEMTAPWGIIMPALVESMLFIIVTTGHAWLQVGDEPAQLVTQGSMVLLPLGDSCRLLSEPDAASQPLFDIPVEKVSTRYEILRHGGGGAMTRATAGVVQFDSVAARRLLSLLPRVLRVDAWDGDTGIWLQSTLNLIGSEASAMRPGGETVLTRLADILVIQAMRAWLDRAPEAHIGWLAALRDPQIGRTLALMHQRPERAWSVADLASEAGMSRSAFAARFTQMTEQPVWQYLTQLRLHLARIRLARSREPIGLVAQQVGYHSEASFGRAFKQLFGVSPGAVRKLSLE